MRCGVLMTCLSHPLVRGSETAILACDARFRLDRAVDEAVRIDRAVSSDVRHAGLADDVAVLGHRRQRHLLVIDMNVPQRVRVKVRILVHPGGGGALLETDIAAS